MGLGTLWHRRARALGRDARLFYTEYLPGTMHDGSEGELYDLNDDPLQRVNRYDDPSFANVRATLSERLRAHDERPGERATPGELVAPV